MESIVAIYTTITKLVHALALDLSQGEPMAMGLITVGILGTLGMLLRTYPKRLYYLIRGRVMVTIQVNDSWQHDNREVFQTVCDFISKHQMERSSLLVRATIMSGQGKVPEIEMVTGPFRPSSGMFFVGLRPWWFSFTEAKEQGAVPETISLTTIGRNPDFIWQAIKLKEQLSKTWCNRRFYEGEGNEWHNRGNIDAEPPIFLDDDVKEIVDKKIKNFQENGQWYRERGLNHKLTVLLYGPPGCGKSRLARYIADQLSWSFGTASPTPIGVKNLVRSAAERSIVMSIPEIDTLGLVDNRNLPPDELARRRKAADKRNKKNGNGQGPTGRTVVNRLTLDTDGSPKLEHNVVVDLAPKEGPDNTEEQEGKAPNMWVDHSALGVMLNLLQGDLPLNNSVLIMQTNDLSAIDPAVYRPGRCELKLEVGPMRYKAVNGFFKHYYSRQEDLIEAYKSVEIRACDIMDLFNDNMHDAEAFKKGLLDYVQLTSDPGHSHDRLIEQSYD